MLELLEPGVLRLGSVAAPTSTPTWGLSFEARLSQKHTWKGILENAVHYSQDGTHKTSLDTSKNGFYPRQQNKQLSAQTVKVDQEHSLCYFLPMSLFCLASNVPTWLTVSCGCDVHEGDLPPHTPADRSPWAPSERWLSKLWQGSDRERYYWHIITVVPVLDKRYLYFYSFKCHPGWSCCLHVSPFRLLLWRAGGRLVFEGIFSLLLHSVRQQTGLQTGRLELGEEFVFSVVPRQIP